MSHWRQNKLLLMTRKMLSKFSDQKSTLTKFLFVCNCLWDNTITLDIILRTQFYTVFRILYGCVGVILKLHVKLFLVNTLMFRFGGFVLNIWPCECLFERLVEMMWRFSVSFRFPNLVISLIVFALQVAVLQGDKYEVTAIAASPDCQHLACGYVDGTIRIFSLITGEANIVFAGHRSAISCLVYDAEGMRLASGSHVSLLVVNYALTFWIAVHDVNVLVILVLSQKF